MPITTAVQDQVGKLITESTQGLTQSQEVMEITQDPASKCNMLLVQIAIVCQLKADLEQIYIEHCALLAPASGLNDQQLADVKAAIGQALENPNQV